jgi:hypothetical protein
MALLLLLSEGRAGGAVEVEVEAGMELGLELDVGVGADTSGLC